MRALGITFVAVIMLVTAYFVYAQSAHVPRREIDREIPDWYTSRRPHVSRTPLPAALREAAKQAEADHVADPVPQLTETSGASTIHCDSAITIAPDQLFIECFPRVTDCAVLYRCTADGKLLWKAFDSRSP